METLQLMTPNTQARTRNVPIEIPPANFRALGYQLIEHFHISPDAFLSNAVVQDKYVIRMCIVNFRTSIEHIEALPDIVVTEGRRLDAEMRPVYLH